MKELSSLYRYCAKNLLAHCLLPPGFLLTLLYAATSTQTTS